MVEIGATSSLAFTSAGTRALSSLRQTTSSVGFSGSENAARTKGISPGRFTEVRVTLSQPAANQVVSIGVAIGNGVVAGLKDLRAAVQLAGHGSLVSTNTNLLNPEGSRVSIINIQAQANILLDKIDGLIAGASVNGANIVSSDGAAIRLQTSRFGGGIDIQAQPLDRAGLGLQGLDLLSSGGIDLALGRIDEAIVVAGQRVDRLASLQRALSGTSVSGQFLDAALGGFGSGTLERGSLINLIA